MDSPETPDFRNSSPEEGLIEYLEDDSEEVLNYVDPLQDDYDIESLEDTYNPLDVLIDSVDEPSTSKQAPASKKVCEYCTIIL